MSAYSPNLGFTPSTLEDNISTLRNAIEVGTGMKYNSDAEFLATNIHLLFEGFSTLVFDLENNMADVIKQFMTWLTETQESINKSHNATFTGFLHSLEDITSNAKLITRVDVLNNTQWTDHTYISEDMKGGICIPIILLEEGYNDIGVVKTDGELTKGYEQPEDLEKLENTLREHYPSAGIISYDPEATETPANHALLAIGSGVEPLPIYYALPKVDIYEFDIKYKVKPDAVVPLAETEILTDLFVEKFKERVNIGSDFFSKGWFSECDLDWILWVEVGWKKPDGASFSYTDFKSKQADMILKIQTDGDVYSISTTKES